MQALASRGFNVFTTIRSATVPSDGTFSSDIRVIPGVDLAAEGGGADVLEKGLKGSQLELVFLSAGILHGDNLEKLNWEEQVQMYKVSQVPGRVSFRTQWQSLARRRGLVLNSESG